MSKKDRTIEIEASIPTTCRISYWYERDQELTEGDRFHIKELLEVGVSSGELLDECGDPGQWSLQ